ncbi:unnamed protein product [Symbiodinium natans]|uniref:Uncharacterized protein n=1 Tax=Symbiodinium natans TaxID=878477 RepID=A0A812KMR0_9DINO|nr:unnamed protein product [Symbiodinium natans]
MALSSGPLGGLAGDLKPYQHACSLRDVESEVDPASFEHYVELLRQGSAGALRVAAASRLLQREAHKTSTLAKAALGAATSILDHPDGTPGMLAKRETERYAIAWWNRYFRDLTKYEPRRIRARRRIADAMASKDAADAKLTELESINKDEFRRQLTEQRQDLQQREMDLATNTQSTLQMKKAAAEAINDKKSAAKYRDMLDDYWHKRELEQVSVMEAKRNLMKQERFLMRLPFEMKTAERMAKFAGRRLENAEKSLGYIKGHLEELTTAAPLKPTNPYERMPYVSCYRLGKTPAEAGISEWLLLCQWRLPRAPQQRRGDFLCSADCHLVTGGDEGRDVS